MITSLSLDIRYDELVVSLKQIDALLDIATSTELSELKPETITNYFYVLSDVLQKASKTCDSLAHFKTPPAPSEKNNNDD